MNTKKGMTASLTIIISLVVLLIIAALLATISSDKLNAGGDQLESSIGTTGDKLNDIADELSEGGSGTSTRTSRSSGPGSGGLLPTPP